MAHNILNNDMAYVGEKPWHGLGTELGPDASIEDWTNAAGMDFELHQSGLFYITHDGEFRDYDGMQVLHRSDSGEAMSVTSERYKIVQPAQVMEFFAEICKEHSYQMETAGVLQGGKIYWGLAKTTREGEINGDLHELYMLLTTSCDRTLASQARPTGVRVVCWNTLSAATRQKGKRVNIRHNTEFDIQGILRQLDLINEDKVWATFTDKMQALNTVKVDDDQAEGIFNELLRPGYNQSIRDAEEEAEKLKATQNELDKLLQKGIKGTDYKVGDVVKVGDGPNIRKVRGIDDLITSYHEAPGAVPGTMYGVLQGVTHWADHVKGKDETRLHSALYGQSSNLKDKTLQVGLGLATGEDTESEFARLLAG